MVYSISAGHGFVMGLVKVLVMKLVMQVLMYSSETTEVSTLENYQPGNKRKKIATIGIIVSIT